MRIYFQDQNMIQWNEEFPVKNHYFGLIIKDTKKFWMEGIIVIFCSQWQETVITYGDD